MTDEPVETEAEEAPQKQHAIVPRSSVAGNALTLVVAIMAFLASLTLGSVSLVRDTAASWQSDIAREVTVQVKPVEGIKMETALLAAREIAGSFPGVLSTRVIDDTTMTGLLEPWLGSGLNLDELPVPRLITLEISEDDPPDFKTMRERLVAEVPGASLDNHRAWVDRLSTMAQTTIIAGFVVFLMMMVATVLTVVFATRGAMSGNAHVIEVLHFVGAERSFIANEFQRHFLLLGLKGAVVGGALAVLMFLIVSFWASGSESDPAAEQAQALFGSFSMGPTGYLGVILLVFLIALLTALTSRLTVLRHVGSLDGTRRAREEAERSEI